MPIRSSEKLIELAAMLSASIQLKRLSTRPVLMRL
jgi:hypothetical protein